MNRSPEGFDARAAARALDLADAKLMTSVFNTVDTFDAAAHLEAMGFGQRTAAKLGYTTTFAHADDLVSARVAGKALTTRRELFGQRRAISRATRAAVARSLAMLAGVLICLGTLAPGTPPYLVFVAGASGWLSGQAVSAGIWQGLGSGSRLAGYVAGAALAVTVLAVDAVAAVVTGTVTPLLWGLWACAIAVLLILHRPTVVAIGVVALAVLVGISMLLKMVTLTAALATGAVLATAAVGVLSIVHGVQGHTSEEAKAATSYALSPVVLLAVLQAAAQLALLGLLMYAVGPSLVMPLAVAGLAASSISEPGLDLALARSRRLANRPYSWRALRWRTSALGALAVAAAALFGIVAALVLLAILDAVPTTSELNVFLAAAVLTCVVSAGAGLQLRTGSALGATGTAVLGMLMVAIAIAAIGTGPGTVVATIVAVPVILLLSSRRTSRPHTW